MPPKVTAAQRKVLDKKITGDDLDMALKQLPNGKCPGLDGFQKEFYAWGWDFIKPVLLEDVDQMWEEWTMGEIINEGLIAL